MARNRSNGNSNKPVRANSQKKRERSLAQKFLLSGGLFALTFLSTLSIMAASSHDWQLGVQLQAKQWDAALKIDLKSQSNR